MDDLIQRQTVLDMMQMKMSGKELYKAVYDLPPITPQQKTGHWIDGHCSECGCDVPAYIIDWKWQKDMNAKYCPNCGAKMGSEE